MRAHARLDHQMIFGTANQAVIERFALHDAACGASKIGVGDDERRCVAGSNADRRCARPVRGADHRLSAGRQDQPDAAMAHQRGGGLPVALAAQPLHEVDGRACRAERLL